MPTWPGAVPARLGRQAALGPRGGSSPSRTLDVSRRRSRLVDRFEEAAGSCRTVNELGTLLEEVTVELGFRYFALLHHASLRAESKALVRIDNYPAAWAEEFVTQDLAAHDPVHRASARTHLGFVWDTLDQMIPLGSRQRDILERSARFGLGAGFTVPVNIPGEPGGSCSFVASRGTPFPEHRLLCANLIGALAFETARRLRRGGGRRPPPVHLSPRERECLRLLAAGKTDWEISVILGLSAETVHHYVKRARAAYDVVSRSQLVACGLRDAWIGFDDAIPPSR